MGKNKDRQAVFSSFFFQCYMFLWKAARPFLRRTKRLRDGWQERVVPDGWSGKVDAWMQAASGGEAYLVLAVLRVLPEDTELDFLLCTWTRQGKDVLEKGAEELSKSHPRLGVTVRFAPLDEPGIVSRAMEQSRPEALFLLETELWPSILGACAERGIPVHVLNGRMSKTSFELYKIIAPVLRDLPIRAIHAMSREDAARFSAIFCRESASCFVGTMPNIKFDRAAESLAEPPATGLVPLFRHGKPVILLASVREQEERVLAPLLGKINQSYPGGIVVVAPRHMHRVKAWKDRLHDLGFQPLLASELAEDQAFESGRTVVWDVFGNLQQLYAAADVVFVGGSLGLGGQNFLEALSAGLVPCVGSSLENFRWALGEDVPPNLVEAKLLRVCKSAREIQETLIEGAARTPDREEIRTRFLTWLAPHTGGSRYAAGLVLEAVRERPAAE